MKKHMELEAARNSGDPEITPEMLESMTEVFGNQHLEISRPEEHTRDQRQSRMERAREDLIKGGGRRMKKARKCLIAYGLEHAISHAIEDGKAPVGSPARSFPLC